MGVAPVVEDLKAEFESIGSEGALAQFAGKLGLARTDGPGQTLIYTGALWGLPIEIRERWWDPSSVYTPQPDKHEAVLTVDGSQLATIRFVGNS
jgi:hypothetical protein